MIAAGKNTEVTGQDITSDGAITAGKKQDGTDDVSGDVKLIGKGKVSLSGNMGATKGVINISGIDVDNSNGKIVAGNAVSIVATDKNIKNDNGIIIAGNGLKLNANNGSISNENGTMINVDNSSTMLLFAGNAINNTNGQIAGDGMVLIRGQDVSNANGTILSRGATSIFAMKSLYNSGMIGSKKTLLIYGASALTNSGTIMSNDVLTINGDPTISNTGKIVSGTEISIFSPTLISTAGLGAPKILITGYDQLSPYRWEPYIVNGYMVHWVLEAGAYIPGNIGMFSTALDAGLYKIQGNTPEAKAKLIELPLAFLGMKGEAKAIRLAGQSLNVEEKIISKL